MKQCKLTVNQLMLYLDDAADTEVINHITDCATCQRRARELEQTQRRFGALLHGVRCPDTMQLGEYHLRYMPADEIQSLRSHIRICSRCLQRLNELAAQLEKPFDGFEYQDQTKDAVPMSKLPQLVAYPQRPQPHFTQGMRGHTSESTLTYTLTEGSVSLRIQPDSRNEKSAVIGLLLGAEHLYTSVRLLVAQTVEEVAQSMVNPIGGFSLESVQPGAYDLEMITETGETVILRELNL